MTFQTSSSSLAPNQQTPLLSGGNSALSTTLSHLLTEMHKSSPQSITPKSSQVFKPLEETKEIRLFNAVAALKLAVAEVSMHLDTAWRTRLFTQIDMLHEPDDWDESYQLTDLDSFKTFLRLILQQGPLQRLGLGIDDNGHILASWRNRQDMLSLIFLGKDRVRWAVVRHQGDEIESAGGRTSVERLPTVLQAYNPEFWYGNANNLSAC
jgi:hypothetical protein